jgi:hypothetical protein
MHVVRVQTVRIATFHKDFVLGFKVDTEKSGADKAAWTHQGAVSRIDEAFRQYRRVQVFCWVYDVFMLKHPGLEPIGR